MYIFLKGYDSTEIVDVNTGLFTRIKNDSNEVFCEGSKDWVCTGFSIVNNSGRQTQFLSVLDFYRMLKAAPQKLFYKNGKPRFRVCDLDHGTNRIWSTEFKAYQVWTRSKNAGF